MSRTRRIAVGATLALLVGGAAAGCGSGQSAETSVERSVTHGVEGKIGDVSVHNAYLAPDDGGESVPAGGGAYLAMVLVNSNGTNAAHLVSITAQGFGSTEVGTGGASPSTAPTPPPLPSNSPRQSAPAIVPLPSGSASASSSPSESPSASASASGSGGRIEVGPGQTVSFGVPSSAGGPQGASGPTVHLTGATDALRPTAPVKVTLDFGDVGTLTLLVPVQPFYGTTETATPIPTESPTTPTEIVPPGGTPTPSPTKTPAELPVSTTPLPTQEVTVAPTPSASATPSR